MDKKFGEGSMFAGDITDFTFSDKDFTIDFNLPLPKMEKKKRSIFAIGRKPRYTLQKFIQSVIDMIFWVSCLETILFIEFSSMMVFWKMKLKPIKIIYDPDYDNCHFSYHNKGKHSLVFGLKMLCLPEGKKCLDKDVFKYINYKFTTEKEKLFFVLAHEIGHYIQYERHTKWVTRLKWSIMPMFLFNSPEMYRKHPVESNADKLAIGICKQFKIGKIKTK
jgi:hypothetical protein